jgi:phospholipase D1/2
MTDYRILREGRNCWRLGRADRVTFLVDGEAYFSAFAAAVEQARQSIFILGWDIDGQIRLWRDGRPRELPEKLGDFLNQVVSRRRGLRAYVLDWDFAMIYALEREPLPIFQFGWRTHRRLHFALDAEHPVGASHHQKVVVVDDRVAFVGGFDLARARWDTPKHLPGDERRCDHGEYYPPFHDVQLMVEGEVAGLLGRLARERWHLATGSAPNLPAKEGGDPWPERVSPDLRDVEVAISRTIPAYKEQAEVQEIKQLYLDAIAAATTAIYIENQYLTAVDIADGLAARLAEEQGPEVVLVLPMKCSGWLEESTMGILRARLLRRLQAADHFGRLGIYYPVVDGPPKEAVQVHAKVLVVDDWLVRVGSSNLNNRSMGYDTECDLAIEAAGRTEISQEIEAFRNRLLAEHLGVETDRLAEAIAETGSLLQAVESLRQPGRTLEPLSAEVDEWLDELLPEAALVDPEQPARLDELVQEATEGHPRRKGISLLLVLMLALALTAAWRWTPLGDWLDLETFKQWGEVMRASPFTPLLVLSAFLLGGLVLVPVTLLILVTALTFAPVNAFFYALAGCLLSAVLSYGIGRLLGRDAVRRLAGGRLNRISRWLGRRGLLAVAAIRLLPIAPFTVVNLVAGASQIRLRDFFFGTLLGMGPGVLAITIFEKSLEQAVTDPQPENILILAAVLAGVAGLFWIFRRWLERKKPLGESAGGNGD